MSSTIKLYEHNQKAYDALLDMLGERDRACVIKPTGTGKFVIIAKMVQDNPDKRFLLLGTNDYMFNDQMANLAEIAPGFTPENLQFMTYSAAMMTARRGEEISGYDVVVADEFHHCGAEEWGKGVTHILDANESAKVVGFSATPIRYSDGGRNMADEMFDGNVAYSMELEEAWLRGILPIPKYVTAFYEAPKELGRLAKSITGRPRIPFRRRGAPERGCTHHGHHEPVHVVHGKALQAGGCRRPHRIRVDGQGARVACRRARDACRAAMARTTARSRVDTCLGRVKRCFSHALIFAAQVCVIYVVILLSGLLVFWSAIFIDSKGRKFSRQEDSRILRKHHREIGKTMAINRVTIMGNLTRDAELRKKGDATSVLTFGLAINEKKKDSETGEYVDAPVFVDCALFGARAEALAPYLTKGKKVSVDGRLRYHSWMKNEEKRHALSVLVTDIEFADSKGAGKDTVSAQGQSAEPETYDADIPF